MKKNRIESVSYQVQDVRISKKEREKSAPRSQGRHEKFQLGTNPMEMTPFEKSLVEKERLERLAVRRKQILGMQGVDGGETGHESQFTEILDRVPR